MLLKNKIKYISFGLSLTLILTACEKSLNINQNPNEATSSSPELVLPQAIVGTSRIIVPFSTSGSRIMYYANAGGVSGWGGSFLEYTYTSGDDAARWSDTYNNLMDYDYVIKNTEGDASNADLFHAAQIMRAYNFANLVDMYNDVPYSEAFQGRDNLLPKYDKAQDIYADLASRLDAAIVFFKSTSTASPRFNSADVIFKGNLTNWARLANTLKLKLVVKGEGLVTFANQTIDAIGVLTDDAIVQPVFTKIDGKQNPMWNTWAYNAAGAGVGTFGTQFIPTDFVLSFYDGYKLTDPGRAEVSFANGLSVPTNQLGDEDNPPGGLAPSSWVLRPNTGTISATNYRGVGIVKGPAAGQPIMLLAEAKFLEAEAIVRGLMTGDAKVSFESGIMASYDYLYKNESDIVSAPTSSATYLATYKADNALSYLADFDLATTDDQKIEAIITQKYIAFNFLFGHEAWNEYRRTGYPSIIDPATSLPFPNTIANSKETFVSIRSLAPTPDKLPTRYLYPNTEVAYNGANVPDVSSFTSKIFWAR
jgi:hypothetical protein